MRSAKNTVSHYIGEKPVETVANHVTRKEETDQVRTAQVVRNVPLSTDFMPLGYNRENILNRIALSGFFDFRCGINPNLEEEYSPTGHPNDEQFVRSVTVSNGINSNQFIWDAIPELENFPVSGHPEEVSPQYVLYNVEPEWLAATKKTLHIHQQAVPTAYGTQTNTSKSQTVVYQTPVTTIQQMASGSSILQKIKQWLVGG